MTNEIKAETRTNIESSRFNNILIPFKKLKNKAKKKGKLAAQKVADGFSFSVEKLRNLK